MRRLSTSIREHISELGFRFSGKDKSSRSRSRDHLRRLLFEQMEDRRLLAVIQLGALTAAQGSTIFGAKAGDYSGWVSDAGDLNRDGFADFVVGNTANATNLIHVVFGNSSLPAIIDLANLGTGGIAIFSADDGDRLMSGFQAGDMNGDGFDDLILRAWGADASGNAKPEAGEHYVIFGGLSLPTTIDLAIPGAADITIYGADAGDTSISPGLGRSAGDVNKDGYDDLLIGARWADAAGNLKPDAGEGYLIFGSALPPATIDLANLGASGVMLYGANPGDTAGYRVSGTGDVNGDLIDDFMISAPQAGTVGEVYLIFGNLNMRMVSAIDLGNLGSAGVTIRGSVIGGSFGRGLDAAGDINGDGLGDLIITSVVENNTYVIYGGETLPPLIEVASLASTAGVRFTGARTNWQVGGAGDVNNDGFDDLLIGDNDAAVTNAYLVFGGLALSPSIDLQNLGDSGVVFKGIPGDSIEHVSRAGDVNGDGFDDLLIGAPLADGFNNSRAYSGESYLIYGVKDFTSFVKFYVVNDARTDQTYRYDTVGNSLGNSALNTGNTAPRGAASTAAGDKVWVVDANHKVFVYNTSGGILGSWTAGSMNASAQPEGITTNGTDVWIVDNKADRVYRYSGAAGRTTGSQNAVSNFALNGSNTNPKDIVTDGTHLWVVNDATTDKVFKYNTLAGALVGSSWTIDSANKSPTGITLDPSGSSQSLWIVDSGTDRVYEYANARGNSSGSQAASVTLP